MGLLGKSGGAPTVGINIGSSLIKVVEAKPGKDGPQITSLGVSPTPPGAIENEIIIDPQALGQAIKQLLSESGISCKRAVSSVSGQSSVVVRIIEVPKMTKQELKETMKWEVERHVPFAANEVVMDFQPIERELNPGAGDDDQNMEVLLAVAQQDFVNSHIETLFAAGLEPAAIDVEPLAICRALIDVVKNGEGEQNIAVLNIGSSATELGIYQDKILAFPRTLPIAGDGITRAISDAFNISFQQAERLKREKAVVLLDRMDTMPMGFGDGFGAPESDSTIGFAASQEQSGESVDSDMDYIPGLGFGFYGSEEEQNQADSADGGEATEESDEFEVTSFDFDLSDDLNTEPKQQLDLSEPGDEAALAQVDEADEASSGPLAETEIDLDAYSEEMIFDAMSPTLNDLIIEIRRSIEYYSSRYQNQPDKILLCGGGTKLENLDKMIEAELGIPVIIANALENVGVFSENTSDDYLKEVSTVFPVSVGLAIRDLIGE